MIYSPNNPYSCNERCLEAADEPLNRTVQENRSQTKIGLNYDSDGVPFFNYGTVRGVEIGLQRNPEIVCEVAFRYFREYQKNGNETIKTLFLNNADWLVRNSVDHQNFSSLEYTFPFPIYNLEPPWRSALAHGHAIKVLLKAFEITNNRTYDDEAKSLLDSFFVEVENGGVTYKSVNDGWWYEEYARQGVNESLVLNGMMYAVLDIYEYYNSTGYEKAKLLFDLGVLALRNNLAHYDNSNNDIDFGESPSYYDRMGKVANSKYNSIHVKLLDRLHAITGEKIFKYFHDIWNEG